MLCLLFSQVVIHLGHDLMVASLPFLELRRSTVARISEVLVRGLPALLPHHAPLLEHLLLPELVLVLLHKSAVLPKLPLEVQLQALCLLLEERLQHGEELPALGARHLALFGVLGDNLCALREHLSKTLFTLFLVVVKPHLDLCLHVAWAVETGQTSGLQVLQDEAEPSACLTCPGGVEHTLGRDRGGNLRPLGFTRVHDRKVLPRLCHP
mmetsp:Transcript_25717/g.58508  ORF Transcript_25717/g.58508 Transcript_25717/m.58508 type:complete len:210 (-) Transcript_25717:114-743(-)